LAALSDDQLMNCFDDSAPCGGADIWQISDELVRRLPSFSTEKLVACFGDWKICGISDSSATGWPISDEIARRGDPHGLLVRYWNEPNKDIRRGIEDVAYHFDTREAIEFLRRVVKRGGRGLSYWPVEYMAKNCDPLALQKLATGRYFMVSSVQYGSGVEAFGKCGYRAAIPYMVDSLLYAPSLNLVSATEQSLRGLYPDSPKEFKKLSEMQHYYCDRARKEGFHVRCDFQ
jgi:hypothetical protein